MPLPAKSVSATRERAEFALRIVALGALVFAVLQVSGIIGGASSGALPVIYTTSALSRTSQPSLGRMVNQMLLNAAPVAPMQMLATSVPADSTRAMLSAMRAAQMPVRWTDSTSGAAVALEVSALIDPKGGVRLRGAAPSGARLAFRDSLGLIDSATAEGGGSSMTIGRVAGSVQLSSGGASATSIAPTSPTIRRVLVIANPGWEAKFTTAALEERGWNVDVRYALGKNVTVTQGDPLAADTTRYAAVIALDSSAMAHASELRRYVASGGGVVIAGAAGTLRELRDILPGTMGAEQAGIPGAIATDNPLTGISWRAITPDSDGVVLMRSDRTRGKNVSSTPSTAAPAPVAANLGSATIVARRFGAGRVVQIAYDALWQWRMAGPDGSVEAHRQWWAGMVGLVAFAPHTRDAAGSALPGNAAPYADLLARLGAPVAMPSEHASAPARVPWEILLLSVAVASLVAEWASRRLRGAR